MHDRPTPIARDKRPSATLGELHPAWRIGAAAALTLAGVTLLLRPLTSLTVLAWALPTVLAAGAVWILVAGRVRGRARLPWVALLALAAVGASVLHVSVVRVIPVALPLALGALAAARAGWWISRRERAAAARALLLGLSAIVWAVLAVLWPDAASIIAGAAFALLLLIAAALALARPVSARSRHRAPGRARRALLWIATSLAVVVAMGGIAGGIRLVSDVPRPDDFFTWTSALPEAPGVLLRDDAYEGVVPADATARRILYTTTDAAGDIVLASGVVAIPDARSSGSRTVVSWQHGTTGVDRSCAPSLGEIALTDEGVPGIERMIERGWVVVAPDYPGMGTDGPYPYLIGEGEGRSTLDGIRAAAALAEVGAPGDVMLMGHSQGGHATLWAADLAADYAPELDVVAVAALSAASDPLQLARLITAGGQSALTMLATSYVVVPYADGYDDIDLGALVDPAARAIVEQFAARCATAPGTLVAVLSAAAALAVDDRTLVRLDLDDGAVHDRLAENIVRATSETPLFLGQGDADEVISIDIQRAFADRLCAADRDVAVHEYPGRSHLGVIAADSPLIDDLFAWVDTVLAGERPSTCPSA